MLHHITCHMGIMPPFEELLFFLGSLSPFLYLRKSSLPFIDRDCDMLSNVLLFAGTEEI